MLYAYVRVSTLEQNEDRQIKSMLDEGVKRENIFIDKTSGKSMDRPSWNELMSTVKAGDTIIFDSLDRLGRTYDGVTVEWRRLTKEVGVRLRVLDLPFFDSTGFENMGEIGKCVEDMLLSLLAYVAETERNKMLRRQAEGIAIAKAQGKYKGRQKMRLDDALMRQAQEILDNGGSKAEVARLLTVHRGTVDNMIKDGRLKV